MLDDCDRLRRKRRLRAGRSGALVALFLLAGLSGCFGSGKQAGEQLRSALSFDRLPEQYEPPVEEADLVDD